MNIEKMKIRYKKRKWVLSLILASIWLVLGLGQLIAKDFNYWVGYAHVALGILGLWSFIDDYLNQYLTIENEMIKEGGRFGEKLKLNEIKKINRFGGNYILKTDKSELTIHTRFLEPDSLVKLNGELEKLDVKWNGKIVG
ncbi:MAG: hypothetical protein ACJA2S_005528 [Cyclobacteriaceae bacterium]